MAVPMAQLGNDGLVWNVACATMMGWHLADGGINDKKVKREQSISVGEEKERNFEILY